MKGSLHYNPFAQHHGRSCILIWGPTALDIALSLNSRSPLNIFGMYILYSRQKAAALRTHVYLCTSIANVLHYTVQTAPQAPA
jgi:hypothetical protein